jgi:antitoxin HigA-1
MGMYNPPHPGELIKEIYLEPFNISVRQLAEQLHVSPSSIARVISGKSSVSPDMAIRLSKVLGRSAESWLQLQANRDLWEAAQQDSHDELVAIEFV